jgi:hypothetical protein
VQWSVETLDAARAFLAWLRRVLSFAPDTIVNPATEPVTVQTGGTTHEQTKVG